jgi:acyl dehydratase
MSKLVFKNIKVGDALTPLTKTGITRTQISQFAAATNDFAPMHVDEELAKSKGYSGICAQNQLAFAYCEQALNNHANNLDILKMTSTFQKLIWPGDMLTCKGLISKRYEQEGQHLVDFDLWVENQNQDIILKGNATCSIVSS